MLGYELPELAWYMLSCYYDVVVYYICLQSYKANCYLVLPEILIYLPFIQCFSYASLFIISVIIYCIQSAIFRMRFPLVMIRLFYLSFYGYRICSGFAFWHNKAASFCSLGRLPLKSMFVGLFPAMLRIFMAVPVFFV